MRTSLSSAGRAAGVLAAAVMLGLTGAVWGAEPFDEPVTETDLSPRRAIALSMAEAVRMTLENSMDIKIDRIEPLSTAADIEKAESRFDWTFVGSYSRTRSVLPSATVLTGAADVMSDTDTAQIGMRKDLVTGGRIEPAVSWSRSRTNSVFTTINPSYSTDALVTISQPLLRGAGVSLNMSSIRAARNSASIARYTFKDNVMSTVSDLQQTYWDLVFAIEDLDVKQKSLRLAKDTLEQITAQADAGLLAPIEITRVRADVAVKEELIIAARKTVEDKEDRLRRFINQKSSNLLQDVGVVPLERAACRPVTPDVETEVREALLFRPDYQKAQLNIRNSDIQLVVAKNARLPAVDISATLSMNGLEDDTGGSFDMLRTNDFHDWTAGVSVEIPLGNRSAKADYLQARLAKIKALLELKNAEHEVIVNVKENVRLVVTSLKSIRSTRLTRELAEERLRAEEEKFKVGTAFILDVLDAQTRLAEAQSIEHRAIVDYNKSLISLEKAKGTLLERNGIFLTEELGPPEHLEEAAN